MEHDNVLFRRVAHRVEWVGVAFFGALELPFSVLSFLTGV